MLKRKIVLFVIFIICISCEKKDLRASDVIVSGEVLEYKDLEQTELDEICEFCAYYTTNWNQPHEFDPQYAYYVKIKINNLLLAKLCESQPFSKKSILSENPHMLYGKYKNRIVLKGDLDLPILETSKFKGQEIMNIDRKGKYDKVLIGPIVEKPKKIELQIYDSKNYPGITPVFVFN